MKLKDKLKEKEETKELINEADMKLSDDDLDNAAGGEGALNAVPGLSYISGPIAKSS